LNNGTLGNQVHCCERNQHVSRDEHESVK
jgi:hypothetical protein